VLVGSGAERQDGRGGHLLGAGGRVRAWPCQSRPGTIAAATPAAATGAAPGRAALDRVVAAVGDDPVLMLLDNCEHVIDAAAEAAARLAAACPNLRLLATSREPLGIAGETCWSLPSLSLPDPDDPPAAQRRSAAVRLLLVRAAITAGTRMTALADTWLEGEHGWSTGTMRTYCSVVRKQIQPALGQLCLREVTAGVVGRALSAIARNSGPGAAKSARACPSGMFALAIQDGAVAVNPGPRRDREDQRRETSATRTHRRGDRPARRAVPDQRPRGGGRPARPRRLDADHRLPHRRGAGSAYFSSSPGGPEGHDRL
jgi:hypothetical protein